METTCGLQFNEYIYIYILYILYILYIYIIIYYIYIYIFENTQLMLWFKFHQSMWACAYVAWNNFSFSCQYTMLWWALVSTSHRFLFEVVCDHYVLYVWMSFKFHSTKIVFDFGFSPISQHNLVSLMGIWCQIVCDRFLTPLVTISIWMNIIHCSLNRPIIPWVQQRMFNE